MRTDLNPEGGAEVRDGALAGRLRSLPQEAAPPFGFEEFQRRAREAGRPDATRSRRRREAGVLWPMAASVAALALVFGVQHRSNTRRAIAVPSSTHASRAFDQPVTASSDSAGRTVPAGGRAASGVPSASGAAGVQHVAVAAGAPGGSQGVVADDGFPAPARGRAAAAEQWLQRQPRPVLVRVDHQAVVLALEDRIAVVDDQLNVARLQAPQAFRARQRAIALQRDRAQLLESLAQVRYAQELDLQ